MRRTHLPIANPCHEDWDAMHPVERGRFCDSCDKSVFDLSSMTEAEASETLREHAGQRICVRYCHDTAGTIRFRPERPMRAAVLALAMAACTPHARQEPEEAHVVGLLEEVPEHVVKGNLVEPEDHEEIVMGEAPMQEEVDPIVYERKGDIAVPDEPCDPAKPQPKKKAKAKASTAR
jgi:hypothetical protein